MNNGDFSAFPTQEERTREGELVQSATYGLTKREYLSGLMMQSVMEGAQSTPEMYVDMVKLASSLAVQAADALLAELAKPREG